MDGGFGCRFWGGILMAWICETDPVDGEEIPWRYHGHVRYRGDTAIPIQEFKELRSLLPYT